MPYLYNVTDYDELNEWYSTKAEAVRAARAWSDPRSRIRVNRHAIEKLTPRYACKLLTGCGFSLAQETILTIEADP